jgi:hypothetical protein
VACSGVVPVSGAAVGVVHALKTKVVSINIVKRRRNLLFIQGLLEGKKRKFSSFINLVGGSITINLGFCKNDINKR